jgi:rhodanese-related sulfurtransferase
MKKMLLWWAAWLVTGLLVPMAGPMAADSEGFKEISAPEVKNLIEERKAVVINLLSRLEHEIQHIPDSMNIPIIEIETTDKLPQDKNSPLVLYCMGKR